MPQDKLNNCFIQIESDVPNVPQGVPRTTTGFSPSSKRLDFTNTPPDLGTSKSADLNHIIILGRSEPIKIYGSNGPRQWNLELQFFAEDDHGVVVDKINWCESLVYPIYQNGLSIGLPILTFVFGRYINVKCVCSQVTTSLPGPWSVVELEPGFFFPYTVDLPMYGTASLTLDHIPDTPFSHSDVRANLHNTGGRGQVR
jgi:hypothetical protein